MFFLKYFLRMSKSVNLIIIIFLSNLFSFPLFSASTPPKNPENLVSRKVLLLDFVNAQNSADYSYLESSLPDSLQDPLSRTMSFELLNRTIWSKLVKDGKYKKQDAYNKDIAIEAGKEARADVVVIGRFAAFDNQLQVFVKAIELSSGRTMLGRVAIIKLENNVLHSINDLSEDISLSMKEKLPPLPRQVIAMEREKYLPLHESAPVKTPLKENRFQGYVLSLSPSYSIDVMNINAFTGMQTAAGLKAAYYDPARFYLGIAVNFAEIWSDTSGFGNLTALDVFAFVGYVVPLNQWQLEFDVGGGYFAMQADIVAYNPFLNANLGLHYKFTPKFSLGIDLNGHMYYDGISPLLFVGAGLSASYAL